MTGPHRYAYPNARARLRWTRHAPVTPPVEATIVIWLRGARFRVRDETGRRYADILGAVTAPRGFGVTPRTIEDFMDAGAADPGPGATELYGDGVTGEAVVHEAGREPWTADPDAIAPAAEQLLAGDREPAPEPAGESTYLGRPCLEYRYVIDGEEDGIDYRSDIRCLVSAPFVLLREVRDSRHPDLYARTEVLELTEGAVTTPDLRP
jgi:hypothetical protein